MVWEILCALVIFVVLMQSEVVKSIHPIQVVKSIHPFICLHT